MINKDEFLNKMDIWLVKVVNKNKIVKKELIKKLKTHNILDGDILSILHGNKQLETVPNMILFLLCKYLYEIKNQDKEYDPTVHFSDSEISQYTEFKLQLAQKDSKYPIVFDDVSEYEPGEYYACKLIPSKILELFNIQALHYPEKGQRPLLSKVYNGEIVRRININATSLRQIEDRILSGRQFADKVVLNLYQCDFKYDKKARKLIVNDGLIDINDGFHQTYSTFQAMLKDPNIDNTFFLDLAIVIWPSEKAERAIEQWDRKNKLDPSYRKSINGDRYSNLIAKRLNEDTNSYLRGSIGIANDSIVDFNLLSLAIEVMFSPLTTQDNIKYGQYLIKGINSIVEIKRELIDSRAEPIMWVIYIALLKGLEQYGGPNGALPELIARIDEFMKKTRLIVPDKPSLITKRGITTISKVVLADVI